MTHTEILFEPDAAKFVPAVRQITVSGAHAIATGQEVLYVTEAAVFRLTARPMIGASPGTMRAELFAPALWPADCFPALQ